MLWDIAHHPNVIAQYLYHRLRTDGSVTHPWITAIRQTCRMLAQHTSSENDPARVELLERSACLCLAVNRSANVFRILSGEPDSRTPSEDNTWANGLAVAAWIGDMTLVQSLDQGSDPFSFFGRPSWAAAAQGHHDMLVHFLNEGAQPYQPISNEGSSFHLSKSPLGVAAYMGHESIVQLYLQPQYYSTHMRLEEEVAISFAAQGNQPKTLKILLEHFKENSTPKEFMGNIDGALIRSCRRGAFHTAQVALDYGADVNGTAPRSRSCILLAIISGSAPLVKMLLDAGASTESTDTIRHHSTGVYKRRMPTNDALTEARLRGRTEIVRLLETKLPRNVKGDQDVLLKT